MATTTLERIRDNCITLIHALTPETHSDRLFEVHLEELDFDEWVENNKASALRRFSILEADYGEQLDVSWDSAARYDATMTLTVAYPLTFGTYGANNRRDLRDMQASDMTLIDKTIGHEGSANYVSGCDIVALTGAPEYEDIENVSLTRATYRVVFNRDLS